MKRKRAATVSVEMRIALLAAGAGVAALALVRIAPDGVPRSAQKEVNAYLISRWLEKRGARS